MKSGVFYLLSAWVLLAPKASFADRAAETALDRCIQAESRAQTLKASFTTEADQGGDARKEHGVFTLRKPNLVHVVMSGTGGDHDVVLHSNGRDFTTLVSTEKQFTKVGADPNGGNVLRETSSLEAVVFFNPDLLNRFRSLGSGVKIASSAVIGSVRCRVLQVTGSHADVYKVYIGPDDLLRGVSQTIGKGDQRQVLISRLSDMQAGGDIPKTTFAWTPPRGTKLVDQITLKPDSGGSGDSPGVDLLPLGSPAPEFRLSRFDGGAISLKSTASAHKITLVNFWSVNCVFCRAELPELNKMLASLRSQGGEVLSVDTGDTAAAIGDVWKQGKYQMPALMDKDDSVSTAYKVTGVPTNYLVGSDGKIVARFEGFDMDGLRAALTKAGLKL